MAVVIIRQESLDLEVYFAICSSQYFPISEEYINSLLSDSAYVSHITHLSSVHRYIESSNDIINNSNSHQM